MKVLFAVNNDEISNEVVKRYQRDYKEILSYKNVYYFNAILKELQKDKTYDRVVISEDLEPFANNNYDTIDKFLFEKLDNISDEATNELGNDTEIILICSDRRNKSDDMLIKLFGIGIYSAIIGQDRSIDEVCRLINKPRTKKEAKQYYKIETDNVSYQAETEDSVSEAEVQNILAHYKRLGKNEDKYIESFNNIVPQYTDNQLKIIIRYLPISVKAVLEARSPKYQQLVEFDTKFRNNAKSTNKYNTYDSKPKTKVKREFNEKIINDESNKIKMAKPVIVPAGVNKAQVTKLIKQEKPRVEQTPVINKKQEIEDEFDFDELDELLENSSVQKEEYSEYQEEKRGRGRPRKNPLPEESKEIIEPKSGRGRPRKNPLPQESQEIVEPKPGRGRPRKNPLLENPLPVIEQETAEPKRGRGRPRKNPLPEEQDDYIEDSEDEELVDLFDLDEVQDEEQEERRDEVNEFTDDSDLDLFNIAEEENESDNDSIDLFSLDEEEYGSDEENYNIQGYNNTQRYDNSRKYNSQVEDIVETQHRQLNNNFTSLLTKDKKIVSFVGTTKNGTSFIVNNVAHMLASMGIETAILDMTKTRNAYYIYTNSEERLMETAKKSIYKLRSGIAEGLKVNRNLTVYTTVPNDDSDYSDVDSILSTLLNNYSVVLIDCDFNTDMRYFEASQEIYLVQSMDVLTIQPLTSFLRDLQSQGILRQEKLKVVINKAVNIKSVPIKTLIGGLSKYNDPSLTVMKDLFDKDNIRYSVIPFEMENYIKYLDSLITCNVSLNGYTKPLMNALKELSNMIYPLINKQSYSPMGGEYRDSFSNDMNDTLNKMKRRYK